MIRFNFGGFQAYWAEWYDVGGAKTGVPRNKINPKFCKNLNFIFLYGGQHTPRHKKYVFLRLLSLIWGGTCTCLPLKMDLGSSKTKVDIGGAVPTGLNTGVEPYRDTEYFSFGSIFCPKTPPPVSRAWIIQIKPQIHVLSYFGTFYISFSHILGSLGT